MSRGIHEDIFSQYVLLGCHEVGPDIAYLLQKHWKSEGKIEEDGLTDEIDIPAIREIPGDTTIRESRDVTQSRGRCAT